METQVEETSADEKLTITASEWHALNLIRGLEQAAYYMVVTAEVQSDGSYVLEGPTEVFDTLAKDVFEEIYYKMSPARSLGHLKKLYRKLEPDGEY